MQDTHVVVTYVIDVSYRSREPNLDHGAAIDQLRAIIGTPAFERIFIQSVTIKTL